ncbi:MAG: DUF1553 domain-containing protein [Planctomycetes bacterium]|nr:DUF1553 domain-containing protein [Planctomycetota bacterium]
MKVLSEPAAFSVSSRCADLSFRHQGSEQFLDAVSRVSGVWQHDEKIHLPRVHRNMTGGQVRAWRITADPLTRALGRPNREQVVLRRPRAYTTLQALELSNGETLAGILGRAASAMLEEGAGRQGDFVERLYARALQRPPTESERRIASELMAGDPERSALEDLLWAEVMLPEFRQIH